MARTCVIAIGALGLVFAAVFSTANTPNAQATAATTELDGGFMLSQWEMGGYEYQCELSVAALGPC
ncbi:MAG: hypothetical protein ACR2PG_05920 [Hyphomicrobiaceae bacterium]